MLTMPFWISFIIRTLSWINILGDSGLINHVLMKIGFIQTPIAMLYNEGAVIMGLLQYLLPFMILNIYVSLEGIDKSLLEAARYMGCTEWQAFREVTLPLSLPGVSAGCLLVFIPALGEFVIPALLGAMDSLMIGHTLYEEFFINQDWPLASAVAVIMLFILVIPIMLFQRLQQESSA